MPSNRDIPDRWCDYTPIGERIKGTRFIAFKVPLREHVTLQVERKSRLNCESLLENLPNLGMIIDLTDTDRYYDSKYFEDNGVQHAKLKIPGHFTPSENLVNQFKLLVLNFLNKNKNNDKLIGVHCTHGVNRTGYLICHYMISEMKMEPKKAISSFAEARGHSIERENYLNALHKLTESEHNQPIEIQNNTTTIVSSAEKTNHVPAENKSNIIDNNWRTQSQVIDWRCEKYRNSNEYNNRRNSNYSQSRNVPYRMHATTSRNYNNESNTYKAYKDNKRLHEETYRHRDYGRNNNNMQDIDKSNRYNSYSYSNSNRIGDNTTDYRNSERSQFENSRYHTTMKQNQSSWHKNEYNKNYDNKSYDSRDNHNHHEQKSYEHLSKFRCSSSNTTRNS